MTYSEVKNWDIEDSEMYQSSKKANVNLSGPLEGKKDIYDDYKNKQVKKLTKTTNLFFEAQHITFFSLTNYVIERKAKLYL